jgi:hypothetical protein
MGRIFWLLACLLPAFTAGLAIGLWEVVSSYSSATASGFHGIPRIHTQCTNLAKNWGDLAEKTRGCQGERNSKFEIRNSKIIWSEWAFLLSDVPRPTQGHFAIFSFRFLILKILILSAGFAGPKDKQIEE